MKIYRLISLLVFISQAVFPQTDTLFVITSFGEFTEAASVSASRGEFIFVSDIGTNKIYKFDLEGKQLATYGGTGLGKNELNQPVSIDASNGLDVFVCDYLNNRIVRLDYKLNLISIFDFNYYNTQAEISNKIYNPLSAASISTGDLFILCDAGNYKAIRLKEFNDINLYFGQIYDKIVNPVKVTRGNELDLWVLEKSSNELLNFNNLGIFVKRIKLPESFKPVSISFSDKSVIILLDEMILFYDTVSGKFAKSYIIPRFNFMKDINMIDKETILILQKNKILKFNIK